MSAIMVDKFTLLRGGAVPTDLEGYITQNEYYELCNSYQECEGETQCLACACETCICLFTGFICIYCAHPFVTLAAADYTMKERIQNLNHTFYGGRPVMSITGVGSIAFSVPVLDEIRPRQASVEVPAPQTQQPEPAKAEIVTTELNDSETVMHAEPVDPGSEVHTGASGKYAACPSQPPNEEENADKPPEKNEDSQGKSKIDNSNV